MIIELNGQRIHYTVRKSKRAKYIGLSYCHADGLVVVVPRRIALRHAVEALRDKQSWVLRQVRRFAHSGDSGKAPPCPPIAREIADGDATLFLGERHTIRIYHSLNGLRRSAVDVQPGVLRLILHERDRGRSWQAFERWMRERAREAVHEAIDDLDPSRELAVRRVAIRGQRTRWGSCSTSGTLSFNWRLIKAPPMVLHYVVAHELAHLRSGKHSGRFYAELARLMPDYETGQQWLREHAGELWR